MDEQKSKNEEIVKLFKDSLHNITSASYKTRKDVLDQLSHFLDNNDVSIGHLKGVSKILVYTLHRYRNSRSRLLVERFVAKSYLKHGIEAAISLATELNAFLAKAPKNCGQKANGSIGLFILSLCGCMVDLYNSLEHKNSSFLELLVQVEVLAYNLVCCYTSKNPPNVKRVKRTTERYLKTPKDPLNASQYIDVILQKENIQMEGLCMIGYIFDQLMRNNQTSNIDSGKIKSLVELFVKLTIQTKVSAPRHVLDSIKPFLKCLSHDNFKETLLPAIQKALLRNPETVFEAVSFLLIGLSIDPSKYMEDLQNCIPTHLSSQNAKLRSNAIVAVGNLAKQCSETSAVESLLKKLFSVLSGSEGKLASPEQRSDVLSAIAAVSTSAVSGKSQLEGIANIAFDNLLKFLLQEGNESALLQGLDALKVWCKHLTSKLPSSFVESIQKAISAKTCTSTIRFSYLKVCLEAMRGNTLIQGVDFLTTLLQVFDKSKTQIHQAPCVLEALSAATLIARMAVLDDVPESKVQSFWNSALDVKKRFLISEKSLSNPQKDYLSQLVLFMNVLFTHHQQKVVAKGFGPWYQAFVVVLLHGEHTTRKQMKNLLGRLLDSEEGKDLLTEFKHSLFKELHQQVVNYKSNVSDEQDKLLPIKAFCDAYVFVACCGENKQGGQSAKEALRNLLFFVHHPMLASEKPDLFMHIASLLKVDLQQFMDERKDELFSSLMELETFEEMHVNALKTLLSVAPGDLITPIMIVVKENLRKPALSMVTEKDYRIMCTPDGDLFDQSIFENAKAASNKHGNVKRESKAYSYKDQKIEMELKEELKKKNKQTEEKVELTKKQKEQLQVIKDEEKTIRDHLKILERELVKQTTLLDACLTCCASEFLKFHYLELLDICLSLSTSYLAAPHIVPCYLKLAQCIFKAEQKYLGEMIANAILRHKKATCDLPAGWAVESLYELTVRTLNTINTFVFERNVYLMMTYTWKKPFSAPAFALIFPLLKTISKERGVVVKGDECLRMKVLQIVMAHSKLRSQRNEEMDDENGPVFLPRADMLAMLSEIIIESDGHNKDNKLQQFANKVFDEVCKAASGGEGCTSASPEEIDLLLANILSACSVLRNASLKGLLEITNALLESEEAIIHTLARRTMIARYDQVEENAKLGECLWERARLEVSETMTRELIEDVTHMLPETRLAASLALSTALSEKQEMSDETVQTLLEIYVEKVKIPTPVLDNLGRVVSAPFVDNWESRHGVGLALEKIAPYVSTDKLETLFNFFVPTALGDRNENVRKQILDAALQYVNHFGQDHMQLLLNIFEKFLDMAPDSSSHDVIRQSVIILTGSLAKHFDKTDPKIKPIFSKLMAALATPSQQVQQAVANCLPPLCGAIKGEASKLISDLLEKLLDSESYGERRGAAYGLAGIVKGLGILSLKQHDVINTLDKSIQDKKIWRHREGALFAFETLCSMLGRLFEPYVVHLLPHLLLCFGDGNQYVREAADETAKAVMKNLSSHGVKLVLPSLLKALEEDAWRTKTGSVELLGAMSFCAPKQLSSCLPSIVPRLTEVLADSHMKVQKAGQQALRQIGGVIKNPEILEISSIILDALADPNKNTVDCLKALLNTQFVHFIDAPSLALIMPTLEKALDQRSTETKKMAAQILGNMYALTDPKDLSPYLPAVVPGLKKSLLDPSPEVRGVSARALGAIVKGMGEECFNDLMPWLLETLTSEVSSVDRSGAAQGLSEVLYALGQERLDKLMPDVIATTMKSDLQPNIRDGYLMLYIYLPATFGDDFTDYIGPIIPPILKGLADEAEYVRDTSLKAGQRIINMYADTAIEFLLPELEAGLFDAHWRIRYSSVQLLGDLLFKLSGVTGKQTTVGEEDDNFGTAHSSQVILDTLGDERRNRLYAGLYMGRSDVALTVRQAALHVWKVIVQNTARTLRDILPTLFELLLGCLASDSHDKRQVAARTLGDLVRKLGERILPEIIPILENGLNNPDGDKRQGVCIGLSEIMNSTSREMISQFEDSLIVTVRKALVDPLADVRLAASQTFENLHNAIGHRALDGVLPNVFEKLEDDKLSEFALDGLKQVMAVKSKSVLPFLVPKLTTPPVNTKALAILSSVAGEALVKHLEKILPAMIQAVHSSTDENKSEFEGTKTLILSVEEEVGIRTIIDELEKALKHQNPGIRKVGADLLTVFCRDTKGDYSEYLQQLIRHVIYAMNDVDTSVVTSAWYALDAIVKHLDPTEQLQHLSSLKQAIRYVKSEIRNNELPGFCLLEKKGITPVLPIFREGILNGPQEMKEQAATLLGDIIKLTSATALKPSVVSITGPLIRILGDRFNWSVKEAILDTLGLLLEKVGIMLKPFLPQLQTTFIRALNDPTQAVREKSAWALGLLTVLHTRVDSLFTELKNGIKNNEDGGIRETILKALRTITLRAGSKMSEAVRASVMEVLQELLDSSEDGVRVNAGAALGALCQVMTDGEVQQLLKNSLINVNQALDWTVSHGRAVALSYALFDAPGKLFKAMNEGAIIDAVVKYSSNDRVPICTYGIHSLGHLLLYSKEKPSVASDVVITSVKKSLVHSSVDVKLATLKTVKYVSRTCGEVLPFDTMRNFIPEFISLLRDRNTAVKSSAELTLGFLLQLHINDELFSECVSTLTEASTFLQDYHKTSFRKLSDSFASDDVDYQFVT